MYTLFAVIFVVFLLQCEAQIPLKNPHESRGVVLLDSFTFEKIVPSSNNHVVVLVTNKRYIGDYGTDSIRADYFAFSDFVQTKDEKGTAKNILFTQILVNGAENAFLAEKIGLEKNFKYPRMFLYLQGSSEPIAYPSTSPFHLQSMLRFIQQNTGYSYRIPGTLPKYDNVLRSLAKYLYVDTPTATASEGESGAAAVPEKTYQDDETFKSFVTEFKLIHEEYVKHSEDLPIFYSDAEKAGKNQAIGISEQDMSKYYLKIVDGISTSGVSFVKKEIDRVRQLLEKQKLSPVTKTKVKYQLSVLKSFLNTRETLSQEEIEKIQQIPNRHDEEF